MAEQKSSEERIAELDKRIEQIKALHEQGMSVRKIGAELNIPSATVARYLKGVSE